MESLFGLQVGGKTINIKASLAFNRDDYQEFIKIEIEGREYQIEDVDQLMIEPYSFVYEDSNLSLAIGLDSQE